MTKCSNIAASLIILILVAVPLWAEDKGVLVLHSGDKIPAKIKGISSNMIKFEAIESRDAYDYGEMISIAEVSGIETEDGELLTVEHFRELIFKEKSVTSTSPTQQRTVIRKRVPPVQKRRLPEARTREFVSGQLDEVVQSLIDAGLAPAYLDYLSGSDVQLNDTERKLQSMIQDNPAWSDKIDEIRYIDEVAFEAISRTFRYKPQLLKEKLGLQFDEDTSMSYENLMGQLHDRFGSRVSNENFAILVDVFGKGSARAISDLLENYGTWKYLLTEK